MSIKYFSLFFLCAITVSFLLLKNTELETVTIRSNPNFTQSQFTSRGIVDRTIELNVITENLNSKKDSDSIEVTASIGMPFDYNDQLEYKWILGQNINLISGTLTGKINPIKKDKPQKIKLFVTGFTTLENRHIGLEVWGTKNGRRIYSDTLISSQKEKSFEYIVQNVERIKATKLGKNQND